MHPRAKTGLWLHLTAILLISGAAYAGALGPFHVLLTLPYADKLLHLILVGSVALWWTLGWNDPRMRIANVALPIAVAVPLLLATVEEILQAWSPRRTSDVLDWLADAVGLVGFWLLARWWHQRSLAAEPNSSAS